MKRIVLLFSLLVATTSIFSQEYNYKFRLTLKDKKNTGYSVDKTEDFLSKKAIERKPGARSLKGILADSMLDLMYELPKSKEHRKVMITAECIEDGVQPQVELIKADDVKNNVKDYEESNFAG